MLHIITSLGFGGAEILLVDFINEYKNKYPNTRHHLLTLQNSNELLPRVKPSLANYSCLNSKSWWATLKNGFLINEYVNKHKIDIIHAHLAQPIIMSRICKSKFIPSVFTYHNMEYCKNASNYSWKLPYLDQLTHPSKNSHSIFVSNEVKKCVLNHVTKTKNYSVIRNFAGKAFFPNYKYSNTRPLRLVAVGGLKKVKNFNYPLQALKGFNEDEVVLDIFGQGTLQEELQSYIDVNKIPARLKGVQTINSNLLSEYDMFILPSFSEGMPVSLLEAMVTGMPSLLSNLPQLKEVAKGSAFYFNPNEPDELSAILNSIILNKSILKEKSNIARELGKDYSINKYVDKLDAIYKNLLH